ncbi:anaphase-promoting complex subunit 8 [Nematocida displodere]|uniref:Anaphase-promoting complex subunit 8 n=1 Tax=Nematocida displodere TaxID=1805483 RepID=A0A177EA95_9MICR|nr:anaphase-promoting complex subunit 8 [Nematocida displodere]
MAEAGPETCLKELYARCLFDSAEFLCKSGIVNDSLVTVTNESLVISRARNLFYMKEYHQAYFLLECARGEQRYSYCTCCSSEKVFLRNYALYILSQIKSEAVSNFSVEGSQVTDKALDEGIRHSLRMQGKKKSFFDSPVFDDGYLVFLLFLSKREHLSSATLKKLLLYTVKKLPYFWEVCRMLSEIVTASNLEEVSGQVPDKPMRILFILYVGSKRSILHPSLKKLVKAEAFTDPVMTTDYAQSMIAGLASHYNYHEQAISIFEQIVAKGQIRDNLDLFTNVLFSTGEVEKLAALLLVVYTRYYNLPLYHYVSGNLLSLKANHISSIEQFQQILREDRPGEFDIAYVFVAQEYLRLKDTCSAIKACNVAIKKNYNDHRVWSNMAQIYYSIEMFEYALHFFRKSAELAPANFRIYEGLGQCFDKLKKSAEAARCYKKGAKEGNIRCISLLGDLLHRLKDPECTVFYKKYLEIGLAQKSAETKASFCFETAERFLELLEGQADAKEVASFRNRLSIQRHSTL